MTIETGPVPSGTKSSGATHSTGSKGKAGLADKSSAGVPTGFMAILAAMDISSAAAESAAAEGETLSAPVDAAATGLAAMPEMPFLAGFSLLPAASMPVNAEGAAAIASVETVSAESALMGAGVVPAKPALVGAEVLPTVSMDSATLMAQSLQAVATPAERISTAGDSQAPTSIEGGAGGAKPVRVAAAPVGVSVPHDVTGDVAPEATRKFVGKSSDSSARQAPPDLTQINAAKSNGQPDAKAQDFMQRVSGSQVAPVAMELAVANIASPSRREDHASERSIFKPGSTEATYAQPQSVTESAVNAPVSGSSEVASPTESFVAEQISYWISNDVQNAEMKLDGIGDAPVGVSISMHGNEAHVTFRTDELQAREALENASLHLKDLLQREGLVLAGVSVGTSGAGDSGGQEHKPRHGAKAATVVSAAVESIGRRPVQSGAAGRALDLFV